jgi:uncharacterized protein
VVYHVNQGDPGLHMAAMRNVQNHISAVGAENMDIKLVMHGGGINLLVAANDHPDIQSAVDSLKLQGVDFQVCRNTLTSRQMPMEALYDTTEADIVPSGVAQLSILQREGYTYIKPLTRFSPDPPSEGALRSIQPGSAGFFFGRGGAGVRECRCRSSRLGAVRR